MTYIPSVFKSVQSKACAPGANAITAVDKNYTELTSQGFQSSDTSGTVNPTHCALQLTTNTNIQGVGQGARVVTVREYVPQFLRQPVFYGTVTIPLGATSGTVAHGLTLGPKAFVNFLGYTGTRGPGSSLSLEEAQTMPSVVLNGANVVANVPVGPHPGGDGIITAYFCIVDPK